jgi:transcriptional regulator GlxA family with amidase domain
MIDTVCAMRVGLAVVEGFLPSAFAAMHDVLTTATDFLPGETLSVGVVAGEEQICSQSSISVIAQHDLTALPDFDIVVVVGSAARTIEALQVELQKASAGQLCEALTNLPPKNLVAAACTGTFVLAQAGLLDGYRATTSWWLAPQFAQRFPQVMLDSDGMVVSDRERMTAGAALAHIDLALAIVRKVSVQAAQETAQFLIVDERPSQAVYATIGHLAVSDPIAMEFERLIRRHLDAPINLSSMANVIGVSRRTLDRKVRAAFGVSPLQVVRRIRYERAQHLRATTTLSTEQIARTIGYQNPATLRALLRRRRS